MDDRHSWWAFLRDHWPLLWTWGWRPKRKLFICDQGMLTDRFQPQSGSRQAAYIAVLHWVHYECQNFCPFSRPGFLLCGCCVLPWHICMEGPGHPPPLLWVFHHGSASDFRFTPNFSMLIPFSLISIYLGEFSLLYNFHAFC